MNQAHESKKYINELLKGLSLQGLNNEAKEEAAKMLAERFQQVIFNTTVRVLDEDKKIEYLNAVKDPEKNEEKIVEITSQAEGLAEAIEAAMLFEYESLKHVMAK